MSVIESGLIAFFELENNFLDSGPSGYTLTTSGTTRFLSDQFTPHGSYFVSGFQTPVGSLHASLDLTTVMLSGNTPSFTYEFIVYPISYPAAVNILMAQFKPTGATPTSQDMSLDNNGQVLFCLDGSTCITNSNVNYRLPLKRWAHIAYVYDNALKSGFIYANSGFLAQGNRNFGITNPTSLKFGNGLNNTFPFNGYIKSIKIYNYPKRNFENLTGILNLTVPDESYLPKLYDGSFGEIITGINPSYNSVNKKYTIALTGIPFVQRSSDITLDLLKNGWVAGKANIPSGLYGDFNFNSI